MTVAKIRLKNKMLLERLEELAERFGIRISYEKGLEGPGGFCRFRDQKTMIINKDLDLGERIDMLADLLCGFPLDDMFILPEVRDYLECLQENKKNSD